MYAAHRRIGDMPGQARPHYAKLTATASSISAAIKILRNQARQYDVPLIAEFLDRRHENMGGDSYLKREKSKTHNRQYAGYYEKVGEAGGAAAAGSEVKKGKEGVEEEC